MGFDNNVDHINNRIHTNMTDMSYAGNLFKEKIIQVDKYNENDIPPVRCISEEHFGHFLAFHCSSFF